MYYDRGRLLSCAPVAAACKTAPGLPKRQLSRRHPPGCLPIWQRFQRITLPAPCRTPHPPPLPADALLELAGLVAVEGISKGIPVLAASRWGWCQGPVPPVLVDSNRQLAPVIDGEKGQSRFGLGIRFGCALRRWHKGLSRQTSNHYLRAIKQFSRWLARERRNHNDPLIYLAMLNVKVDRRHDRRALGPDEFARLVEAAMAGPEVICIPGPDRAMMYILSAWTGYRKSEIGSLTRTSIRLDDTPPTVTVAACYSKRRRQDVQVLHGEVVSRLREWFKTKEALPADAVLFPVSAKVSDGVDRRTSKMMKADLKAARKEWIEEAETAKENTAREESDFLKYKNDSGLFADFHSNRHTFITNLEHVGVSPRKAQSLARHSDIRLTMGVYTHINLNDQSSAIELLPAPPVLRPSTKAPGANVAGPAGANGHMGDLGQLDALWAKLPEHVKAELLAQTKSNQSG
jgi:site-specific recombinase XerD